MHRNTDYHQTGVNPIMNNQIFWFFSQVGLLLEIAGALYIAFSSVSMHNKISRLFSGLLGFREIPRIVATMQNQASTDITGFLLLAAGLILQFIGNFGL
jgi:hypothetical protein